jgi:pyruvate kinase
MEHVKLARHVKIVSTIGPASNSPETIKALMLAGIDVVRLNLAYGTFAEHHRVITDIRRISKKLKLPIGVLLDLPGTKYQKGNTRTVFESCLEFAQKEKVDFVALSFLTAAAQVVEVRKMLKSLKSDVTIIAKIERAAALKVHEDILDAADGLMVARGDLASEISIEQVPLAQKQLIRAANRKGKPVITATQMLESMVRSPSPTRAEATDVANAVLDGTDAVMLSEETATGKYPVEAVKMMGKIIEAAEPAIQYQNILRESGADTIPEVNDAVARAACQIADQVQAKAIIAFTSGGSTAFRVSKYRPHQPILAVTPSENVLRRLSLVWGILPLIKEQPESLDEVFQLTTEAAIETGAAKRGDLVVIAAGLPLAVPGSTNLVKVQIV